MKITTINDLISFYARPEKITIRIYYNECHAIKEFSTMLVQHSKLNIDFEDIKDVKLQEISYNNVNDESVLNDFEDVLYYNSDFETLKVLHNDDKFKCANCGTVCDNEDGYDTDGQLNGGIGMICPDCKRDMEE